MSLLRTSGARPVWATGLAFIELTRPGNLVMIAAGVVLGGLLSGARVGAWPDGASVYLAALSAALIAAGGNALNDLFDLPIDHVNRRERPLPSGRLLPLEARVIWLAATGAGLVAASLVSAVHLALAAAAALTLYAYAWRLKKTPLLGNVVVAFLVAQALLFGGLTEEWTTVLGVAVFFAFLMTLAREIVKDIQDVEGDRQGGATTFAVLRGERAAGRLATVVMALTMLITPLPYALPGFGGAYMMLVGGADAVILIGLWSLQSPGAERAGRVSGGLKVAMLLGMAALATAVKVAG